ncbi:MAG: hypothetical protein GY945_09510 [Rhodobacteraceae bacterium]|nr:hypothetical protein [Paracoccaceae bacterium]
MSDISDLEGRITAALDKIGQGLDALAPKSDTVKAEEVADLKAALDEEKTANAQLEERVKAIKERQEGTLANLASEVERLRGLLEAGETGVARLRKVNGELRMNNSALRDAASAGVTEPHLVNKSMMAELEALRTAQAADRAELDAILSELEPMITSTGNANEESTDA